MNVRLQAGGVLYIAINSQYYHKPCTNPGAAEPRAAQEKWVEEQFEAAAKSDAKHVVVLSHIAPFMGEARAHRGGASAGGALAAGGRPGGRELGRQGDGAGAHPSRRGCALPAPSRLFAAGLSGRAAVQEIYVVLIDQNPARQG